MTTYANSAAAARDLTAEAHHQALLSAIPDLMFRIRREGTYLDVAGDVGLLARPPETLVGSMIHAILPVDVADPLIADDRA